MAAPPYMKLFWGDYHKRTRHLKRDQHGAYFLLIGEAWQLGGALPDDDTKLAAWALCTPEEWAGMKPIVMEFFAFRRGKWWHDRVREELASYESTSRKRKEAGKKGGAARAGKDTGNREANASGLPTKPEPEPEPDVEDSSESSTPALPKPTRARGARIAEDWKPNDGDYAKGVSLHLTRKDVDDAADEFRDYWLGRSRDAAKADWHRTFRARLVEVARRGAGMAGRPYPGGGRRNDTTFADVRARRRAEDASRMEIPGEQAPVSGFDLGWSDGAIEGER